MRRGAAAGGAAAWGTTILRLAVGVVFLTHGYLAWAVMGPPGAAAIIARLGVPLPAARVLAWYLIVAHLAGGLLIVVGLWTRWAALASVPIMATAVVLVHGKQGFFLRAIEVNGRPAVAGFEYALLVLAAALALVFLGSGAASIDRARE